MSTEAVEPIDITIERVAELARPYYDDSFPFHNWPHAGEVLMGVLDLAEYCKREGDLELTPRIIVADAICHDMLNFVRPLPAGYETFEHFTAHHAGQILVKADYQSEEIAEVKSDIISTNFNFRCRGDNAKALRRSDLANLTWERKRFEAKTIDLYKEANMLGNTLPFIEWAPKAVGILYKYLEEDVTFGWQGAKTPMWDRTPDPQQSRFKYLAMPNVVRLEQRIPAIAADLEAAA